MDSRSLNPRIDKTVTSHRLNLWGIEKRIIVKNLAFWILGSLLLLSGSASAQIVNGDFSTPGGFGWSVVPGSSVSFDAGSPQTANISTPNPGPAASAATIETALALPLGRIAAAVVVSQGAGRLPAGGVFTGSAIFQTFTAIAGDVITFDMAHNHDSALRDLAFASLVFDPAGAATLVAPSAGANGFVNSGLLESAVFVFTDPLSGQNGSWTIATSGTYRIGFGIINTTDDSRTANFEIDQVRGATAIPEINVTSAGVPLAAAILLLVLVADSRRRYREVAV